MRGKKKKRWLSIAMICFLLLTACTGIGEAKSPSAKNTAEAAVVNAEQVSSSEGKAQNSEAAAASEGNSSGEDSAAETPKLPESDKYYEYSFLAVGDVMVHKEQLKRAYLPESDSFDFTESFVYAQPFIESADYAFANLETTLAGRSSNTKSESGSSYRGYSGYPNFNAPESLADALKAAGFDFIGTANNHSLDKGLNGVINTLAYLRQIGLPYTGTFDTPEERNALKIVECGGLKIGVIAYTYATNGIYLKAEEMYRVNTLDNYKAEYIEKLYEDVRKAKEQPIDLLFVLMHYGNEYWEKPEKNYQAGITQKLIELGVDMVIGSHPHTLQPLIYAENKDILLKKSETPQEPVLPEALNNPGAENQVASIAAVDGKASEVKTTVEASADKAEAAAELEAGLPWHISGIYSLGNFISSQRVVSEYRTDTDTGAMIKWVYQWKNDEKPVLVKVGVLPTIVVWQEDRATVLPINEISIAAAKADPSMKITSYVEGRIQNAKDTVLKRLTAFLPDSLIHSMRQEDDGFTYIYLHPEIKAATEK